MLGVNNTNFGLKFATKNMKKQGRTFWDFATENWDSIWLLIVLFLIYGAVTLTTIFL